MGASGRSNAGSNKMVKAKTKKALEDENEQLRNTVDQLRVTVEQLSKINNQQVQRLVQQELLRLRIKELEQQLGEERDE